MKGLAYRKLGRTSSHRDALLRNLVTSLLQHQRISTTYAKAKEAQRMAERLITKAKKAFLQDRVQQRIKAVRYVYDRQNTVPLMQELAKRFEHRTGGYTRLHLHGRRFGDNAPRALLELVDQPQGDLKLQMTAMAMGRELYLHSIAKPDKGQASMQQDASALGSIAAEHDERFAPLTRKNAAKVVLFGGDAARTLLTEKAREQFYRLMARQQLDGDRRTDEDKWKALEYNRPRGTSSSFTLPVMGQKRMAGMQRNVLQSGPQEPMLKRPWSKKNSVIRIGKGSFARSRVHRPRVHIPSAVEMMSQSMDRKRIAEDKFVD